MSMTQIFINLKNQHCFISQTNFANMLIVKGIFDSARYGSYFTDLFCIFKLSKNRVNNK